MKLMDMEAPSGGLLFVLMRLLKRQLFLSNFLAVRFAFSLFPYQASCFFLLIFSPRPSLIDTIIITITIFSNLFVALTALFFTNHCVGLKSDSWL